VSEFFGSSDRSARRARLSRVAVLPWLLLCCVLTFATPLWAKSWRVADFSDTINIGVDGSTAVRERLTLVFIGEWHGIHRFIPVEYPGPSGTNYTLLIDVVGVTDAAGQKLKY
jgi:hypothetical protein